MSKQQNRIINSIARVARCLVLETGNKLECIKNRTGDDLRLKVYNRFPVAKLTELPQPEDVIEFNKMYGDKDICIIL